jgi:bifunctional DNA-binding transcriptional regulator/antitoxin component of YhaV-PrlF toxin-antitoxin module
MTTTTDNGRIYLPKEYREKHGERYKIVDLGDRLLLVPVPEDPLEELREEWGDVEGSGEELKRRARETMTEEAGN